jgi:succinate-semialdehyde dehydrogenase/glutarate-semialdehyde dehydrogenase
VDETIADDFIARVVEKTKKLRQGAGENQNTDIGAMTNENQLRIVEEHVSDAVRRGAKVLCGGERNKELGGFFYKPTVLANVDHTFPVMQAETFGPVLPIMKFKTVEEAVRLANDSRFGLTASIWTKNIAHGKKLATEIEAGTVMINESVYTYAVPETPWGGVKLSGLGHTHATLGLKELVQVEHIHVNRLTWLKDFWWYGYSAEAYLVLADLARCFTSPSPLEKLKAIPPLLRGLRLKKY